MTFMSYLLVVAALFTLAIAVVGCVLFAVAFVKLVRAFYARLVDAFKRGTGLILWIKDLFSKLAYLGGIAAIALGFAEGSVAYYAIAVAIFVYFKFAELLVVVELDRRSRNAALKKKRLGRKRALRLSNKD